MAAKEPKKYMDRRFFWLFIGSFLFLGLHIGFFAYAWAFLYPNLLDMWFPDHLEARSPRSPFDLELWIPTIMFLCLLYKQSSTGIVGLTAALICLLTIRKRSQVVQENVDIPQNEPSE